MTTHQIGFVDYRLDNYHANTFLRLVREDWKSRGWEVGRCWAQDAESGRRWAAEKKVPFADRVEDLRDCDAIMVLAPSNPETHLPMAEQVLPLGRPTYIDKTFAPDFETAQRIFALADRCGVPLITASALRCAASLHRLVAELGGPERVRHLGAWGGGKSFEEYAIHPLEMIVSVMGPELRRLMRISNGRHHQVLLEFSGGRTATAFVHLQTDCRFQALVATDEKVAHVVCHGDPLFRDLCGRILDFFESGKPNIDRRESLAIARALDAARSEKSAGAWVTW